MSNEFLKAISAKVGEPVEDIVSEPIAKRRKRIELKFGSPMTIIHLWPFIGRGGPRRTMSREEIDAIVNHAIR